MPHNRRCDIAQDNPGNLNPGGGSAIMFGLCSGIDDLPTGESTTLASVSKSLSFRIVVALLKGCARPRRRDARQRRSLAALRAAAISLLGGMAPQNRGPEAA